MKRRMIPVKFLSALGAVPLAYTAVLGQAEIKLRSSLLLDSAATLVAQGEHIAAVDVFAEAFALDPWQASIYMDAVSSALAAKEPDEANRFLSQGVQHGFEPTLFIGAEDLSAHLASDASLPFRERWPEDKLVFGATADSVFIKQLDSLRHEDQRYGREIETMRATRRIDSLNFDLLIRYSEQHGFPNPHVLGHSFGTVQLLLWHHRDTYPASDQWQRMLPFIRKAMDEGTLSPSFLSMFDDFSDEEAGRPMRFGSLLSYFGRYPDKLYFVPREELNRNRASVGWSSIENFAIQVGTDLSKARFAEP